MKKILVFVGLILANLSTHNALAAGNICYEGKFDLPVSINSVAHYTFRIEGDDKGALFNSSVLNSDDLITMPDQTQKPISSVARPDKDLQLVKPDGAPRCICTAYYQKADGKLSFSIEVLADDSKMPRLNYFGYNVKVTSLEECKNN